MFLHIEAPRSVTTLFHNYLTIITSPGSIGVVTYLNPALLTGATDIAY